MEIPSYESGSADNVFPLPRPYRHPTPHQHTRSKDLTSVSYDLVSLKEYKTYQYSTSIRTIFMWHETDIRWTVDISTNPFNGLY